MDATDYFECLGFYASPNVNLADFFMDVIGGTIARNNDPGFTSADLFLFWKDWVVLGVYWDGIGSALEYNIL